MQSQLELIVKVLAISTLIAILVKYGGRLLPIQSNVTTALIAILLPSLILGLMLWQRKV